MASSDMTVYAAVFKELYPSGPAEHVAEECPLWGLMPKTEDFYGDTWSLAPSIGGGMGGSDFQTAASYKRTPTVVKFQITRARNYEIISLDAEAMLASSNSKGAFVNTLSHHTNTALANFTKAIGIQCYGDGGGAKALGDSSWTVSSTSIVLDSRFQAYNFEFQEVIEFSSDDGAPSTAGVRPSIADVYITGIRVETGTLTVNTAVNGAVPTVANSDYIFRKSDYGRALTGLGGWVPASGASMPALFGVTRSVHPEKLGGLRVSGSGQSPEETVFKACAETVLFGGKPDTLMMHPLKFEEFESSLHAKVYVDVESTVPGIGYESIKIRGPRGPINVIQDPYCPYDTGWLLQKNTLMFKSLKKCPHFAMDDGKKSQREANSDGIEIRVRGFHNMGIEFPGKNVRLTW